MMTLTIMGKKKKKCKKKREEKKWFPGILPTQKKEMEGERASFFSLPPEVVSHEILSRLEVKDVASTDTVCKAWLNISRNNHLWQTLVKQYYQQSPIPSEVEAFATRFFPPPNNKFIYNILLFFI